MAIFFWKSYNLPQLNLFVFYTDAHNSVVKIPV